MSEHDRVVPSTEVSQSLAALQDKIDGTFPHGKVGPEDQGALAYAVGPTVEGRVVIQFSRPTYWVGFMPDDAENLAALLIKHAKTAREERAKRKLLPKGVIDHEG